MVQQFFAMNDSLIVLIDNTNDPQAPSPYTTDIFSLSGKLKYHGIQTPYPYNVDEQGRFLIPTMYLEGETENPPAFGEFHYFIFKPLIDL